MTLLDETFPFIQRNIECRRSSRSRWRGIVSVCCRIDKETDGTINIWLVETHSIIRIEHNFRRGQSETLAMASELRILSMPPEFLIKNYENFRQVEFLLANSFNEFSMYASLHTRWYSYLQRSSFWKCMPPAGLNELLMVQYVENSRTTFARGRRDRWSNCD